MSELALQKLVKDFDAGKVMMDFYPFTLGNGFIVDSFNISCSDCGNEVKDVNFRGHTHVMNDDHTIIHNGVGYCVDCLSIWPVNARIKAHGVYFRVEHIKNGEWVVSYAEYAQKSWPYWKEYFLGFFRRFLKN